MNAGPPSRTCRFRHGTSAEIMVEVAPLELQDVTTGYGDVAVVRRTGMRFSHGLITTVVGSNGAGKSTAIQAAAGLLRAWKGRILANGEDITREAAYPRVPSRVAHSSQG